MIRAAAIMVALAALVSACVTGGPPPTAPSVGSPAAVSPTAGPSVTNLPTGLVAPTAAGATTSRPTAVGSMGQVSVGPARTMSPGSPPPATAPPNPRATPPGGAITLADNGGTFTLAVGDEFVLQLGTEFDWTVNDVDQSVISRVRNITVIKGAQGVYRAVGAGRTTLTATGDPPCRKLTPACAAPSILFRVNLIVR